MAAVGDDFGEVYTGQAGAEGFASEDTDESYYAQGAGSEGAPAATAGATENEDDIYGAENGAQTRGDDEEDEDEVQIVLDTDNLEKPGYGRGAGSKPFPFRGSGNLTMNSSTFNAITPGGSYSLRRPANAPTPAKSSQQQQKSIFELDIDSMDEKPWRKPGVDLTDYFNYGFNEDSWRQYCEKQSQMRLEQSMQSKIKVFESSRGDKETGGKQELPPELQAMVDGDKRKRSAVSRGRSATQDDWPSRDRGFEHRRRPRDVDTAVVQITTEYMGVPTEGMEEFYIPTTGGAYRGAGAGAGAGAGFAPTDYSTGASSRSEDRRRDDDRKRDRDRRDDRRDRDRRSSSRSPSRRDDRDSKDKDRDRRDRDKEKEKDKDKDRDRRDRDKRKDDRDRDDKDKERDRDDRDDHKRKSGSSRDDDDRAKRRR